MRRDPDDARSPAAAPPAPGPPAIPSGWFCVGTEDDLAPGALRRERLFGADLVAYRTASGARRLVDAYCPHLGAHLGHGGRVEGELLRCPFHGFRFDLAGRCVATGYGHKPPPAARLGGLPLHADQGFVFAWFHPLGAAPAWTPSPLARGLAGGGWTRWRRGRRRLSTHPQETSENGIDLGHFSEVHGFYGTRVTRPLSLAGPRLAVGYAFRHRAFGRALPGAGVAVEIEIDVEGLGVSRVHGRLPGIGVEMQYLVLPTPRDGGSIELRFASRARTPRLPGLAPLVAPWLFFGLWRELRQDARMWERKRYLGRPVLAQGDGPIAAYRRWCRQFYGAEGAAVNRRRPGPLAVPIAPAPPAADRAGA